jgi:hypothetical protein
VDLDVMRAVDEAEPEQRRTPILEQERNDGHSTLRGCDLWGVVVDDGGSTRAERNKTQSCRE